MATYEVKSPVLFLIFNRPAETQTVFDAIKKVRPLKLYVAADAPRKSNDNDLIFCKQTREIIGTIDWQCEVKTLYREDNLGCKDAVSQAISWFFENETEGIILEDDCLPSTDFFRFCDELLLRYRDDNRIGHISGSNFQDNIKRGEADYYYSRLTHVWGWAGWRRVWGKYDISMKNLDQMEKNDFLNTLTDSKKLRSFLYKTLSKTKNGQINTWDYQYLYSNIMNGYLSVIPNNNMISNIGFAGGGTHTFDKSSPNANMNHQPLSLKITHPMFFVADRTADTYTLVKEVPGTLKQLYGLFKTIAGKLLKSNIKKANNIKL